MSNIQLSACEAIDAIGGVAAVAAKTGISIQAIYKWKRSGIPPSRAIQIEALSGISRHQLRPDIFGEAAA
jgi:DNA-binding transcriptional regulator YdaS (Cro superfamily)